MRYSLSKRPRGGRNKVEGSARDVKSDAALAGAMREVHKNVPSTVKRAKHFGPGGPEAMKRAIAFSKARKRGK